MCFLERCYVYNKTEEGSEVSPGAPSAPHMHSLPHCQHLAPEGHFFFF